MAESTIKSGKQGLEASLLQENIASLLSVLGISQKEFALKIGLTPSALTEIRKGRTKSLSQDALARLISEFRVNLEWFLTGSGEMFLTPASEKIQGSGRSSETLLPVDAIPMISLRLYGKIPASPPSVVDEDYEYVKYPKIPGLVHDRCYLVRVSGSSMKGAGILDGDVVLVDTQREVTTGDFVIAFVEGEGTLKKIEKRGDRIFLVPQGEIRVQQFLKEMDITELDYHIDGVVVRVQRDI